MYQPLFWLAVTALIYAIVKLCVAWGEYTYTFRVALTFPREGIEKVGINSTYVYFFPALPFFFQVTKILSTQLGCNDTILALCEIKVIENIDADLTSQIRQTLDSDIQINPFCVQRVLLHENKPPDSRCP